MSEFIHTPVMLVEVLASLDPKPGGRYVDGTIGGGGHAAAILGASSPNGWLSGCDRDGAAVEAARERLRAFEGRFEIRRGRFEELGDWVEAGSCDGAVLDLGISSPQVDQPERGFSFQRDGPLDMRMDDRQTLTAARLVNETPSGELARIFWELGEERYARRLAEGIARERQVRPFQTTRHLAELIERLSPRRGQRLHPATRVFQALRLAVNDELGSLERGLQAVWKLLRQHGRLAAIAFHSLEDQAVKRFGRALARDYEVVGEVDLPEFRRDRSPQLEWVSRKAFEPTAAEVAANPRARSARLRVMRKA